MRKHNLPVMTFFDVATVADALSVSQKTVRKLVAQGLLPAVRIGGAIRIAEHELREYLSASVMKRPAGNVRPALHGERIGSFKNHFA